MIKIKDQSYKPVIDLDTQTGSVRNLTNTARSLADKYHLDSTAIVAEMMSQTKRYGTNGALYSEIDYEKFILVFDKHLGSYVDLIRSNPSLRYVNLNEVVK